MSEFKPTPLRHFDPKTLPRRKTRPAPLAHKSPDGDPISICEEDAPKEIFWRGTQWAVTDFGVETWQNAPYHYYLAHDRLRDPHLPKHMSEKGWALLPDFLDALNFALRHRF